MQRLASSGSFAMPIARGLRQPGVVALAAALAMLAFLLWPREAVQFPYTPDSADYIEQARSLLRGENARVLSDSLTSPQTEPSRLFPLGFPLVLAILGKLGIEPSIGALVLNGAAAVLLPLLLFYLFAPLLSPTALAVLIAVSVFSPGLLGNARLALSDTFALVFCVAAIGVFGRSSNRTAFVVAGCLAGIAYAIRNANVALVAAFYGYFVLAVLARFEPRGTVLHRAAWFTAGLGATMFPFLLRNLITFGEINPYLMPASTIGLLDNVRMFVAALVEDLTGSHTLGKYLAWRTAGALAVIGLLVASLAWTARRLPSLSSPARRVTVVSLLFAALGAIVVIAARTRYEWGELIGVRYTFPYVPFIALAAAALFNGDGRSRRAGWPRAQLLALAAVVLVAWKLQNFGSEFVSLVGAPPASQALAFEHGREAFCGAPKDTVLVSNFGFVFRIGCEAPVHAIAPLNRPLDPGAFFGQLGGRAGVRPLVVGLFPGFRRVEPGDLPIDQFQVGGLEATGFEVLRNEQNALVAVRPKR